MTWSQGVMSWGHSSLLSDVLFLYPKRANIKQIYVSKFSLISELTLNGAIVPCSKSNILTLFISLVKTGIHPIFISFSLVDLPASHRPASIPVVSFFTVSFIYPLTISYTLQCISVRPTLKPTYLGTLQEVPILSHVLPLHYNNQLLSITSVSF